MQKISKYELCDLCRKIHPIMNDGKPYEDSIGDYLDRPGYYDQSIMMNRIILCWLQDNGGCSKCIDLFKYATQYEI